MTLNNNDIQRLTPLIRGLAQRYTRHLSKCPALEANDLMQEAWLAILEHPSEAATDQRIQKVANAAMVKALRHNEKWSNGWQQQDEEPQPGEPPSNGSPCLADIEEMMKALSPRARQIIKMHYGLDGQPPVSCKQIAQHMHCTERSVKAMIVRARQKMRQQAELYE